MIRYIKKGCCQNIYGNPNYLSKFMFKIIDIFAKLCYNLKLYDKGR